MEDKTSPVGGNFHQAAESRELSEVRSQIRAGCCDPALVRPGPAPRETRVPGHTALGANTDTREHGPEMVSQILTSLSQN